jgi:putative membrane protein
MYASALMAFLHHLAAFTVVAALAVQVALFKPPLTVVQARRLARTDIIFGAAAGAVFIVGMLRVAYFEKGPAYYFRDAFFLMKLAAFLLASLISIYPTRTFLSWRKDLKAGLVPQVPEGLARSVRMCMMLELTLLVVVLAGAALMARGFGFLR